MKKIENATAILGTSAMFQCSTKGSLPITLTWMKDKDVITESNNVKMSFENNIGTLHIGTVEMNCSGKYSCHAENEAGSQKCLATLIVKGQFDNVLVCLIKQHALHCQALLMLTILFHLRTSKYHRESGTD